MYHKALTREMESRLKAPFFFFFVGKGELKIDFLIVQNIVYTAKVSKTLLRMYKVFV